MKKSLFRVGVSSLLSAIIFPGCFVISGESLLNGFFEGDNGEEGDYLEGDGSSCEGGDLIVAGVAWQGFDFVADDVATPCTGARFVRFSEEYDLYVGVSLCDDDQYKIFLGDSLDSAFHQIGDYSGTGQDHCELVNPNFTIEHDDFITSGNCSDCETGPYYIWDTAPLGTTGYRRGYFGEPFELIDWQEHMGTVEWYRCGVSFDAECDDGNGDGDNNGSCGDPEVNVVSVYESHGEHSGGNHPNGSFDLHVDREGPQVLVLASYEPITWNVTANETAQITKIIASGYHAQTVNGPAGVPVEILSYEQTGSWLECAYEYPDQDPTSGCETPDLFAAIEAHVGAPITSFNGCYQMSAMNLNSDLSADGDCSVDAGYSLTGYINEACTNDDNNEDPNEEEEDPGTGCGEESICGDGILAADEECDDGNNTDNDGCGAECTIEANCDDPADPNK